MGYYAWPSDVEARLSAAVVRRIADDSGTGTADAPVLDELIASAESRVEGACRDVYSLSVMREVKPDEIRRLVLDGVVAYAAMRFPRAMAREWEPLMTHWVTELRALRKGEFALDIEGPPEPAANKGGEVLTADIEAEDYADPVFLAGTGDF
jgi:hypothetical protein